MADVLVTTEWLAAHLGDDDLVVAEVDEDPDLYEDGHIPGAVKLHWRDDLQDPIVRDIVEKADFERLLGSRGIGNDTTIVLYGDKNNWFAAYAYWYLKIYGHATIRILDGGRQKWIDEGRELTTDTPAPNPATYTAQEPDESIRVRRDNVLQGLADGDRRALVDVRSPQEYSGELMAPPAPATFRRPSRSRGPRPSATTAPSSRPTSCASSTAARASRPRRKCSPTAASASAARTRGSCSASCSTTPTSRTTTARGPSGATWSTSR
jgi:thiosulfate/3-mercaptopyruvate sulfurtransferase